MRMTEINPDMNFCRRCGTKLTLKDNDLYKCGRGHSIFHFAAPASGLMLFNTNGEVLIIKRARDPGKGMFDLPGGFCESSESLEDSLVREIQEETGISPDKYTAPEFVLSDAEPYEYQGETKAVLAVIFKAELLEDLTPEAGDDAESAVFMPVNDIDMNKVYLPTPRRALEKVKNN